MDLTEDRINEHEEKSIDNNQTKAQRETREQAMRHVGHNQEV